MKLRWNAVPPWVPWLLIAAIPLVQLPYFIDWTVGLNSDHAVPYLMARHVLLGEHRLFFWGNRYMGTLEVYATAALMRLFRSDAVWLAELPPLFAYIGAAAILVARAEREKRLALAFLLLLPPPAMFVAIDRPGFSQGAILWLGWATFIALRPALAADPLRPRAFVHALAAGVILALTCFYIQTGLVAGLALALLVPVAIALDFREHTPRLAARTVARAGQAALALLLGALGYLSTRLGPPGVEATFDPRPPTLQRLRLLGDALVQFSPWSRLGPTIPGLTTFYGGVPLPTPPSTWPASSTPTVLVLLIAFGLICFLGVTRIFAAAYRNFARRQEPFPFELVQWTLVGGGLILAFLISGSVWDFGSARYLTSFLLPVLLFTVEGVRAFDRRIGVALGVVWLVAAGAGELQALRVDQSLNADIANAYQFAEAQGAEGAIADYWLGYVVDARWRERLIVTPAYTDRYAPYSQRVARARRVAVFDFSQQPPLAGLRTLKARRTFGEVTVSIYDR